MSKECKTARNTIVTTVIVVLGLLILCSSCGSLQFGDYNRWQQVHGGKANCSR